MTITTTLSKQEFARVSNAAYSGKSCKVFLANNSGALTADSTTAEWLAVKLVATNGYEDYDVASLPSGGLDDGSDNRWEIGEADGANQFIVAAFTADGGTFSFDTVVVVVDSSTYPHSIITETPAITVADGQTQTYRVQILLDAIG